jgi:hypothetical protein
MIARLFKNTHIKIGYKTKNTIQNNLQYKEHNTNKYTNSGIYQMKCHGCSLRYIGQTGRNFKTRFKEHIQDIKYNKPKSKYAEHILDTQHSYNTIETTMDILQIQKKGPILNTLERYYIYNLSKDKLQLNDTYIDTYNPIFNIIRNQNIQVTH